jgi:hypothetical protein
MATEIGNTRGVVGRDGDALVGVVHVHSAYSRDGTNSLEELRARAIDLGIRFIAMTDHAEDFDAQRFAEYTAACRALSDDRCRLIPGLEFRFARIRGLHLLACGLDRWVEAPTPDAFAIEVADVARLTIMAHPVLAAYRIPPVIRDCIDAIEVWNAAYNTRYLPDPRAITLLQKVRLSRPAVVGVAGLDQHDAANDRRTRLILTDPRDHGDPLIAIREGRFTNRGQTMSFNARAELPRATLAALTALRAIFDRVEWTQERIARARRRGTRPRRK